MQKYKGEAYGFRVVGVLAWGMERETVFPSQNWFGIGAETFSKFDDEFRGRIAV